jgi:outer membrane protein assembly factor BamB
MLLYIFSIPVLCLGLVASLAVSRRFSPALRRATMVAAIVLASATLTLVRTGGVTGDGRSDFHWRWTKSPEEQLLAQARDERALAASREPAPAAATPPPAPAPAPSAPTTPELPVPAPASSTAVATVHDKPAKPIAVETRAVWPGFRGPNRDGVLPGVEIETDWSKAPPVELWRRKIGPGWSSFAVQGNLVYTQEQRGDDEIVSCYNLATGAAVWMHKDAARFYESNGGAGPRGTPTLSGGRVYTLGATGIVNVLDAGSGAVVWSRNAATDTGARNPGWGFAGSPLVVDDLVVVAASGRLVAYEIADGKPRWFSPHGSGYSSPHLATMDGVEQILLLGSTGAASVKPADGTVLWEHKWEGVPMLQPARVSDADVLIATGDMSGGMGIRRLSVAHGSSGWSAEEKWTSRGLKPYFNDFVVHEGHAYGFDGSILSCIDLADGARKWKGGRYGNGQLMLLPDEDVLLVLTEDGELALVQATPDQFTELAKVPALEGKTWNHPVLAGDVLLVRNGEEMAAFRLSMRGGSSQSR